MLLFLDIDGVMIPAKGWKTPEFLDDGFPAFSSKAIHALQSLLFDDVTIMLTTSHKSKFTVEEWKSIFKKRDLDVKNLKCLPDNKNNLSRKDEILLWFKTNHVSESFVIIDDDKSLHELPKAIKENLVLTSPYIGLIDEHSEYIKGILSKAAQTA